MLDMSEKARALDLKYDIDGHDIEQILKALDEIVWQKMENRSLSMQKSIGKGVDYMEKAEWHGAAQCSAICRCNGSTGREGIIYGKSKMIATRDGFEMKLSNWQAK